jgi:RNA recognition motif-containing protein
VAGSERFLQARCVFLRESFFAVHGISPLVFAAGDVVHAEIIKEPGGIRSKGCGIVEFATVERAQQAIEMLTDTDFRGRMVFVREDRETSNQSGGPAAFAPNTTVFVKNLNPETTWFQLKDYMRRAGNVDSATIHTNAYGEVGSGIVSYQRPQDASRAIRELNDTELMGYQISVREDRSHPKWHCRGGGRFGGRSRGAGWGSGGRGRGGRDFVGGRSDTTDGTNLFVGNLPFETNWSELKDHFKQCGEIKHAEVKRGYGIVQFRTRIDAEKAIAEFNGTVFQGRNLEVRFDQRRL